MAFVPLGDFGQTFRPTDPRQVTTERTFKRVVYFEQDAVFSSGASAQALARSANFSVTDETGWGMDGAGNAWFYGTTTLGGSTVVLADLYSGNWVSGGGSVPATLPDTSATTGYYLDYSAGKAQFQDIYAEGGQIGNLFIVDTLTLSTGGVFRTADSGQRVEISEAENDRINFFSGLAAESAEGYAYTYGVSSNPVFALVGPTSTGQSGLDFNYVKLQTVGASDYGIELLSVKQDIRLYLTDSNKEVEFTYAGTTYQRFANDYALFGSSSTSQPQLKLEGTLSGRYWGGHVQFVNTDGATYWDIGQRGSSDSGDQGNFYIEYYNGSTYKAYIDLDISPEVIRLLYPSQHADGTFSLPGIAFGSDSDSGFYRIGSNNVGMALGGTLMANWRTTGVDLFANAAGSNVSIEFGPTNGSAGSGVTFIDWHTGGGADYDVRLRVDGGHASTAGQGIFTINSLWFRSPAIWNQTSGSAANVVVTGSTGNVVKSTSSRKYKRFIDYDVDYLADIELRPTKHWRIDDGRWRYGLIAEDLAEQDRLLGVYDNGMVENYDDRHVMAVMAAKINRLERMAGLR